MPGLRAFSSIHEIKRNSLGITLAFIDPMVRRLVCANLLLLLLFSSCGSASAPTYSMQVTNVTPQTPTNTGNTSSSSSSSLTTPPNSLLFQSWSSTQSKLAINFSPLAESLSNEITYDTVAGDQCEGHVEFNAPGTILALTVDDGASDCADLNGIYVITVTQDYLTLASTSNTFDFEN
jgi:hypothetical protein